VLTAPDEATPVPTVADLLADPAHGGSVASATRVGEASREGHRVRVGVWVAEGRVVRARFLATTCAPLLAFAEAACAALEAGATALPAAAIRARVRGVHPGQRDRAALVARAVRGALLARGAAAERGGADEEVR
jgi:hypothetical protein